MPGMARLRDSKPIRRPIQRKALFENLSISRKTVATKKHENLKKRTAFPGES